MDDRLLVPATRALLEGWVGPVQTPDGNCVALGRVETIGPPFSGEEVRLIRLADGYEHTSDVLDVALDLARAECRDRVARVVAVATELDPHRLRWGYPADFRMESGEQRRSYSHVPATVPVGVPVAWDPGLRVYDCPALAALAPADDTRLPDGSRLVDALALAAVAREVLRG